MKEYPEMIPVMFMTVGFGVVGFLDDYLKIVKKQRVLLLGGFQAYVSLLGSY